MAKGDGDTSAHAGQSKRPQLHPRRSTDHANESDSQVSDTASQSAAYHRPKHQKHVVGHGRLSSRVPSSKALHKSQQVNSNAKLNLQHSNKHHRRQLSHSPTTAINNALTTEQAERPPMLSSAHRRTTSDVRLPRDSSASNLKKNVSHTSLKRNKSHVEVGKKSKSAANIKRSSSHKEVNKLKGGNKTSVHFDLGNDGQDDEWVDASASASPYLSRRGSVISSGQGSAKQETEEHSHSQTPPKPPIHDQQISSETPERERVQHKEYLTSRLLQRTPSHGAPPKMSSATVQVRPRSISPDSAISRASTTLYGSPNAATMTTTTTTTHPIRVDKVGTPGDELISRFVSGPGSGVNPTTGSFFSPTHTQTRVMRPQSLGNLHEEQRSSADDDVEEEDTSALAPRTKRSSSQYKAVPADKSRTQQKLNLQRASSSIEPVPAGGGGVGAVGASPLLGGAAYDNRDPRIGKLFERTGQEYLVVRRYQNPIARSIARLQQLPGADKTQHIPKQNGTNGSAHGKKPSESGANRYGLSSSVGDAHRSRPGTPRRHTSVRTNGANSSFEADGNTPHLSESGYVDGEDDGLAALLRNLWDKNPDLSASQD